MNRLFSTSDLGRVMSFTKVSVHGGKSITSLGRKELFKIYREFDSLQWCWNCG